MRFKETKPDKLVTQYGIKGLNIWFAVPCFMVGVPALLTAWGAFGWEADAPPWAGFLIGFGLIVGGVALLTYRSGFILDRRRGVLIRRRGVFGLDWKAVMLLTDLKQVTLRCERREKPSDSSTIRYTVYPIWIESHDQSFKFTEELEHDKAQETARHAAETLDVVLMDRSEHVVNKTVWL